jgi:hypothetical protein
VAQLAGVGHGGDHLTGLAVDQEHLDRGRARALAVDVHPPGHVLGVVAHRRRDLGETGYQHQRVLVDGIRQLQALGLGKLPVKRLVVHALDPLLALIVHLPGGLANPAVAGLVDLHAIGGDGCDGDLVVVAEVMVCRDVRDAGAGLLDLAKTQVLCLAGL